jgi:hypothetical protein
MVILFNSDARWDDDHNQYDLLEEFRLLSEQFKTAKAVENPLV